MKWKVFQWLCFRQSRKGNDIKHTLPQLKASHYFTPNSILFEMGPIKQSYTSFRKSMSYKMVNVFVYLFVSLFVTDCESLTNFFYYSLCNRQDTISQVHSYTGKFIVHHYLSFCLTRRSSSPEMLHKKGVLQNFANSCSLFSGKL